MLMVKRPLAFLIAFSLAVAALGATEWALARFLPFNDPFARFKVEDRGSAYVPSAHQPNYSLRITPEEDLPGVRGASLFTTNNLGFRGPTLVRPKPKEEYRIVMIGGSTTECMVVDDGVAPHRILEEALAGKLPGRTIRVYNAGKAGDKSYDHIALLAHRVVHLQPDLITVLVGANDLRAAMMGADYLHMGEAGGFKYSLGVLLKFAATEFQIPRRLYALLHNVKGKTERERLEEVQLLTDYREKASLKTGHPVSEAAPRTDLVPYRNNLATLVGIARAHGIQLVFVTQATTWNSQIDPSTVNWHWMTLVDGVLYREDRLDLAMESYNDEMRTISAQQAVPVFDLARVAPKSLEFFYDDEHFNTKGAAMFGARLADFIATRVWPRTPPAWHP